MTEWLWKFSDEKKKKKIKEEILGYQDERKNMIQKIWIIKK